MTTGYYETLNGLAGPMISRAASSALDEHEFGIGKTIDTAIAAVLYAIERNIGDPNAMSLISRLVGDVDNDPSILADPASLLEPNARPHSLALGNTLLSTLLGAKTATVSGAIARATGVGSQSAATLMPMAGALVLAALGKRLGPGVPGAHAVAGAITAERPTLTRVVPGYLAKLILPIREPSRETASAARPAASATTSVPPTSATTTTASKAAKVGSGDPGLAAWAWLLLPLALLIAFVWFLIVPELSVEDTRQASSSATRSSDETRSASDRDSSSTTSDSWKRDDWRSDAGTTAESRTDWSSDTSSKKTSSSPPLAGLIRLTLANGYEIDVVSTGVEPRIVEYLGERDSTGIERWFEFDRVRFPSGSSELTPGSRAQLRNISKILKAYPDATIKIGGYTDNIGSASANQRLSEARANSVLDELFRLGVERSRMQAEGFGDLHPVADNATEEGRSLNRRTAISIRSSGAPPAVAAGGKALPISGLVRLALADGNEIDAAVSGVEAKMLEFIGDPGAMIEKTKWFDFDRVRFMTGSAQLTPGSRAQLRNVAKILKANPYVMIKIGGYTDNVGDTQANLRLSDQRAKRVMQELVKLGIPADRLDAEGYGDQHPIADNSTAEGRAKNRRTALSIRAK